MKRFLFESKLLIQSEILSGWKRFFTLLANYVRYGIIGTAVRLDVSTVCQLKCFLCPTGKGMNQQGTVGRGFLRFETFKKFIDEHRGHISKIEIAAWGEVLLNPDLGKILQHAHENKVAITINTGVNMNFARDDILESLVKYGIRHITVSIDGATNEVYKQYRIGGNLDNVLRNIKKINEFKREYKSIFPQLSWQFIVFKHNIHELPLAREMAQELGMDFYAKPNNLEPEYAPFEPDDSPLNRSEEEFVKSETDLDVSQKWRPWCFQLWLEPQINWDGKLMGCCVNRSRDFGNVFEQGMKETMTGADFDYMKEMVLGLKPPREDMPCLQCPIYKERVFQKYVDGFLKGEEGYSISNSRRWRSE